MIFYKLYQGKNEKTGTNGKWYARAVSNGTVSLDELAEHMSNHNTPFSAGAIKGMLTDMVSCIKELLIEGKQVKLPDLAIFSVGLSCVGASSRDKFMVKTNVTGCHLRARATGKLNNGNVTEAITLKEYSKYDGSETTGGN